MVDEAVEAIRSGKPVVLPTDTVYGLCATPYREDAVVQLYQLKRREGTQPIALMACDLDVLLGCVPELRGRAATLARALLPGPYTLVLPNPARRFAWLTGTRPETIGVRVPELKGDAAEVLAKVGAVAATSANLTGHPDPRRLEDVAEEVLAGCAVALDGGELPGTPSTVLDLTGPEPLVLREGAAGAEEALERLATL